MSESSFLEVASAIRRVLQQNLPATQYASTNRPTIEQLTPQPPIPQPFIDLAHHASSWKLPEAVSSELAALIPAESMKYQDIAGRAHLQLLQEIYGSCDSMTAASLVPHAKVARDALHARMVNTLLDSVHQLAANVDPDNGAVSDADESSESDSESGSEEEEDDDETEVVEDPDEDENTPMKPGEEVPPLETKYLPIFEALHERGKVLTKPEKTYLVNLTGMTYRQITIWFQNRRRGELKEDTTARLNTYALSLHSDQSSELSDDDVIEKKLSMAQPSDTTFNIRSWRLASAVASGDLAPAFPPSPTKVGFTDASIPRPDVDDTDSDLSDSDDDLDRSDNGVRVPSLTTSSTAFDSSSDRGPATIGSASSSQAIAGMPTEPAFVLDKAASGQGAAFARPIKHLPPRRTTPPAVPQPQRAEQSHQPSAFNFNFAAPSVDANPPKQSASVTVPPAQPPQFVTSNERGLTVEMDTTPPRSTITLQSSSSTTPIASAANPSNGSTVSPPSPVLPNASPNSASSPSPSGNSASSPKPAVKPLPRRTGCAPRPRPPPRVGSIATSSAIPGSARSSVVLAPVVLPPSSNPSLAGTTLGALLRPNIPPPSIPPEMEERLSAMAGRMGVGAAGNGQRRNPSTDVTGLNRPRSIFQFGPSSLPGAGMPGNAPPGLSRRPSPKA
ncbi:unnamed protein product [Rhizoctonia solani]|uniref:Homeobox domain-containing protein n=1 Tax=Rhizoctonia solani TaxID=456999 RepID=A0A8H3E1S1_9AGAM|nr:unnamed protein product [Rhizoctonia solani]